jgi:ABC-type lipoprotein export system ATPase subunit
MLELIGVEKTYPAAGSASPIKVLKGVSLSLERGRVAAIIGPSGSGKSTLLNIAGALDRPTAGSVLLDGLDLGTLSDRELSAVRNRRIGFVFQLHHLLPQCTLLENVLIPTLASGRCGAVERQRAADLLETVGLSDRVNHRPGEISAGQCQRVALVRALINEPEVLLADEPTGSLDASTSVQVADLLVDLNTRRNVTVIVATHSPILARRIGNIMELKEGILASAGERA